MKLSCVFCAVVLGIGSVVVQAAPVSNTASANSNESLTSYRADVASTKLTLYQEGGAHVLENRDVRVSNRTNRIFFANLLGQFDENFNVYGDGILFTSIPNPSNDISFLQNYEGKSVKFVELNQAGRGAVKNGTLVRLLGGDRYVIKFGNEIEIAPPGYLMLSDDSSMNQDKPSVGIKSNTDSSTKQFELSYNIANLNWAPQYQIDLSDEFEAQKQVVFSGYVVVKNNNTLDIKDCDLSLVSGRGASIENSPRPMYKMAVATAGKAMVRSTAVESDYSVSIQAQSFQDRWMFDLPYKYTIGANATTKIQFFDKLVIPATKEYIFENGVWFDRWDGGDTFVSPNVQLHFDNQAKIGERAIGLPAGRVSVFDAKTKKFLSETYIQNSPFGTKLDINLPPAFDVVAKRYQTEYELLPVKKAVDKLPNNAQVFSNVKASFKMVLENRSATAKTIKVIDRFDVAGFQMKVSNQAYKIENNRVIWEVLVDANSKSELTYTAILQHPL